MINLGYRFITLTGIDLIIPSVRFCFYDSVINFPTLMGCYRWKFRIKVVRKREKESNNLFDRHSMKKWLSHIGIVDGEISNNRGTWVRFATDGKTLNVSCYIRITIFIPFIHNSFLLYFRKVYKIDEIMMIDNIGYGNSICSLGYTLTTIIVDIRMLPYT